MIKANDKIKVHLYGCDNKEIKTRKYDEVFTVYEQNGKLGIDWNTERSPYTCKGEVFNPFETFASTIIFEDVENGNLYRWDNITNGIIQLEALTIKDAYKWIEKNTTLMQDTMMLDFECLAYCVKRGILREINKELFTIA